MPDIDTVSEKVAAWSEQRNARQVGIDWRLTMEDARIKLKRLYPLLTFRNQPLVITHKS